MSHITLDKKKLSMLAAAATAVLLAACGGGGGSGPLASAGALTGVVVDGYLQGAAVFLDMNRNGVQDAGEPSTTTDLNGRYTLDYSEVTGSITGLPVVVTGGVDSDTGFAFAGKLAAPVESARQAQVVTPLTTLVDAMVAQGLAADVASAKQQVATALGLTVDQLSTDPVAAIASNPGIYTTAVALQRSIQLLASANAITGESSHESQERVIRALATAIRSQTSPLDVSQLIASVPLSNSMAAQQLATAVSNSVKTGLDSSGQDGAKAALRAMDEVRTRMESDRNYSMSRAANKIDAERGKTTSRPYYQLTQNSSSTTVVNTIRNIAGSSSTTLTQPTNTAGRLLASNCFQCHGTGGVGGFDRIRGGDAAEIREYLSRSANSSIMAAHAQGYTTAQLNAIIAYLQQ
ncbi:MAG: c-type cytochrome [Betaproteobacteria bacterium]